MRAITAIFTESRQQIRTLMGRAFKPAVATAAAIVIALLYVIEMSRIVPFNMDEFIVYHAFACNYYPFNSWNIFGMGCGSLDLSLPAAVWPIQSGLPLRSYGYLGSAMTVIYYPLFSLWSSPYSARLLGILMLILQAVVIGKLIRVRFLAVFLLLLLWFPYSFQHLVDTGQLSFQTTTVLLTAYLSRLWGISLISKRWLGGALIAFAIGLLLSFGVWIRLSFIFTLPALALLVAASVLVQPGIRLNRYAAFQVAAGVSAFIVPTLILLLSQDQWGAPYYRVLFSGTPDKSVNVWVQTAEHFVRHIMPYLFNPSLAAHVVFSIPREVATAGIVGGVLVVGFLSAGLWASRRDRRQMLYITALVAGFIMTLAAISLSPRSWAMHHVMLAYPFLLLAIAFAYRSLRGVRLVSFMLGMMIIMQAYPYVRLQTLTKRLAGDHINLPQLNDVINDSLAETHAIVVLDWGMSFIKALYGPREQMVFYTPHLKHEHTLNHLRGVLRLSGRKLALLHLQNSSSDIEMLKEEFPGLRYANVDVAKPWQILYEQ